MESKKKILIVDDEKSLVALVGLHMRMSGYEVMHALDGQEALELARREKPSLVILDIMLPQIDGWEVCQRLRGEKEIKDVPVIMLSALSEKKDILKGFEVGADDYITKPFSPRELVERVKKVLARVEGRPAVSVDGGFNI